MTKRKYHNIDSEELSNENEDFCFMNDVNHLHQKQTTEHHYTNNNNDILIGKV